VNDLWWQNPFRETGTLRSSIDRALEAQTIGHATALTTVNETIRAELERRWSRPADVILSGFDPDELPPRSRQNGELRLLFAGTLYPTVDLSPLFAGISAIIQDRSVSRKRIELRFVGGGAARFALQAESHGLADLCKAGDPVPRSELLQELVDADALVLPVYREQADILQMRFFEYVGAGRPIIALGPTDKLSSRIVREEGLGVSVSTPEEMEDALTRLLTDPEGGIPVNERARARFTWDERIRDLARVLERAAGRL